MELTATETTIVKGVADGKTNAEIARGLGLSMRTVETYRLRLCERLGLASTADVVKYAVRNGLSKL